MYKYILGACENCGNNINVIYSVFDNKTFYILRDFMT